MRVVLEDFPLLVALLQADDVPHVLVTIQLEELLLRQFASMLPSTIRSVHFWEGSVVCKLLSQDVPVEDTHFDSALEQDALLSERSLHQLRPVKGNL